MERMSAKAYRDRIGLSESGQKKGKGRGRAAFCGNAQTVDGIKFDSQLEIKRYHVLKIRQRLGEIKDLKFHPSFKIEIGGQHFCTYSADFDYIECATNARVIEEVKSEGTKLDAAYRLRMKAAELYHGIKVAVIIL